jgi:hypothetical protein
VGAPDDGQTRSRRSTIEGLTPLVGASLGWHHRLHALTTAVLAAIFLIAVVDGVGWWNTIGVDSTEVEASGGGYVLAVRYGSVTRPALATPFDITVTRQGGFDAPVTVAVDHDYLMMWDENGLTPAPSAETVDGDWLLWEFDPPVGDTLTVVFDARIEPAVQNGRSGAVAVVEAERRVVQVDFETRVLP